MDKEKFINWLEYRREEVSNNYVSECEKKGAIHQIDFIKAQVKNGVFNQLNKINQGGKSE